MSQLAERSLQIETLASRMQEAAQKYLKQPAIIEHGRVFNYQGLLTAIHGLAARLVDAGATPGTCIALVLPNGAWFVSSFFAIAHVGGIVLPLNPSLREPEIASILEDAQVSLVLTVRELRAQCVEALRSSRGLGENSVIVLDQAGPPSETLETKPVTTWPPERAKPNEAVLYLYSSGSTGRPKRVERTHANILWEIDRLVAALQLSSSDRVLGVTPFSHTNGLIRSMLASLLSGATLITLSQFERRAVGRAIEESTITVFIGVPFMFAMLGETRWPRPVDFSSLRLCISSSAPLRSETYSQFYQRYGIPVRQIYGTTETGTISVNLSDRPEESIESVGTSLDGITVDIFSEDGRALATGEVGEIGIKSPAATCGYPNSPDQTRASFKDGYFFPGDIGRKDKGGRTYLLGRKTLFINRGGYKVSPYEIEDLIHRHPKVQEAVVVGVATEYGDQKIKAIIVSKEFSEEREIIEFCRGKVADFKIPSIVEFRTELPKSSTGKILRKDL